MTAPETLDSRYSWTRLVVTLAIAAVANVGMWSIIVVMPGIEADFAITRADASLPYTLTMLGLAAGSFVIGRAVDRYGVTLAICAAAVLLASGYVLAALAPDFATVAGLHLLIGLGTGAGFAPLIADISHWFSKRRGIAVAIVASGNYVSGAFWPMVLSGILTESGWRSVYFALAAIALAVMIPLSLLLRRRLPEDVAAHADSVRITNAARVNISPRTLQILLMAAGIGCCVAMSMPQVHIVSLCADLGYGPAVGAEMLSLMLLGGIGSRLCSGLIADKLGGLRTLLIGSTLQCIALFLYLPFDGLASLYMVSLVFGLSQGGIVPSYALVVREFLPAREAGARVGVVIMATILGMALGGWLSGFIYDLSGSYQLAFINGIGWNLFNMAIIGGLLIKSRPRPDPMVAA